MEALETAPAPQGAPGKRLPGRAGRDLPAAIGVGLALVFLITFALIATQLLQVTGLVFAGGLLLLWVAYNMWSELHPGQPVVCDDPNTPEIEGPTRTKTFLQAAIQITVADLSMSLDNVLLVASIAREEPALLFIGLSFSVLFMGLAANYVARLIQRYSWINYVGLAVILIAFVLTWFFRVPPLRKTSALQEQADAARTAAGAGSDGSASAAAAAAAPGAGPVPSGSSSRRRRARRCTARSATHTRGAAPCRPRALRICAPDTSTPGAPRAWTLARSSHG